MTTLCCISTIRPAKRSPPRRSSRPIKDHQWPGLAAVGKVEPIRETAGKTTSETAYYLLSAALTPERFNEVVRSHWGVENRLHWRLDVIMNEDQDRSRLGNG